MHRDRNEAGNRDQDHFWRGEARFEKSSPFQSLVVHTISVYIENKFDSLLHTCRSRIVGSSRRVTFDYSTFDFSTIRLFLSETEEQVKREKEGE